MATQSALRPSDRRRISLHTSSILVVDDEADIRELLELSLVRMGLAVESAGSIGEAKALLQSRHFDLCLTDMRLPDGDGLDLVKFIGSEYVDIPVAVITAYGTPENAVAALKTGAFDYLTKPLSLAQLRTLIKSALALPSNSAVAGGLGDGGLLGSSAAIVQVRALIDKLARSQAPVYITGESGSGKELAARLIHGKGARRGFPFVAVNCGAIPENLVESEFFGYRKGAFTGADADRDGFFQAANGGTLFLDEVADLPIAMQVKLLRAIQEKRVRKVGSTGEDSLDVRIMCATHQSLSARVEAGQFRQDLYYRLAVIELRMPSLRECREDVPILSQAILKRLAGNDALSVPILTHEALSALSCYDFPGNVRELENVLERAVALAGSNFIQPEELQLSPPGLGNDVGDVDKHASDAKWPLQEYLDKLEREAILEALGHTRFNRTAAAKLLGITFRALRYRMARLGIE